LRHNLALRDAPEARREFEDSARAFDKLDRANAEQMSYRACSENIAMLRDKLVNMGTINGHARFSTDGDLVTFDKRGMEREVAILKRYVRQLGYTHHLHDWIDDRRKAVSRVMNKNFPADRLWYEWHCSSGMDQRLDIIHTILNVHRQVYSAGAIPFRSPTIEVIPAQIALQKNITGSVRINHDRLRDGQDPPIQIAATLFGPTAKSFREAFLTSHHEFVHWALASLVVGMHTRELRGGHRLYPDIEMENEKLRAGAIIDSAIRPAYRAQPEEELCFGQEDAFCRAYLGMEADFH
jgi:hypothetical protein